MTLTATALNEAADAIQVDTIKLHNGAPGAAGADNEIANTGTAVAFGPAVDGVRPQAAALAIAVPGGIVSHYTLWMGTTLKAVDAFATSETYAQSGTANIASATLSVANAV